MITRKTPLAERHTVTLYPAHEAIVYQVAKDERGTFSAALQMIIERYDEFGERLARKGAK
jgi:hypothetical protein